MKKDYYELYKSFLKRHLTFHLFAVAISFLVIGLFEISPTRVNAAPLCSEDLLGKAKEFTVFTFGNLKQNAVDTTGRMAVGGDMDVSDYAVGLELTNSYGTRDDLIVGGNLSFLRGQIYYGNVVYGKSASLSQVGIPNGTVRKGNVINFNAEKAKLISASQKIATYPTNGTLSISGGQIFYSGSNSDKNVFSLTPANILSSSVLNINAPAESTVIVNISGLDTGFSMYDIKLSGGITTNYIIYNFYEAKKVNFAYTGVKGAVLAPLADITTTSGNIDGSTFTNSFSGSLETHLFPFLGCLKSEQVITPTPTIQITPTPTTSPTIITTPSPTSLPTSTPTQIPTSTPMPTVVPSIVVTQVPTVTQTPVVRPTVILTPEITPSPIGTIIPTTTPVITFVPTISTTPTPATIVIPKIITLPTISVILPLGTASPTPKLVPPAGTETQQSKLAVTGKGSLSNVIIGFAFLALDALLIFDKNLWSFFKRR